MDLFQCLKRNQAVYRIRRESNNCHTISATFFDYHCPLPLVHQAHRFLAFLAFPFLALPFLTAFLTTFLALPFLALPFFAFLVFLPLPLPLPFLVFLVLARAAASFFFASAS